MRLKFGAFSWVVIGVVLLLIVAAVFTVNFSPSEAVDATADIDADSPAAPVVAAVLAVQEGDAATARAQFTEDALDQIGKQGWDPIANAVTNNFANSTTRRVRIVKVSGPQVDANGEEYAYVSIAEDNFGNGGLFGRSVYTNERAIRVTRVDGVWKIDDMTLFY